MSEIMTTSFGKKFDELRAKYANTPEDVEEYEQTVRTVMLVRKVLMTIDVERQRAGLSKAELPRRIGADPSVVRGLFANEASNPTLKTVIDLLSALGIGLELRPAPRRPKATGKAASPRRRKSRQTGAA